MISIKHEKRFALGMESIRSLLGDMNMDGYSIFILQIYLWDQIANKKRCTSFESLKFEILKTPHFL